MGHHFTFKIYIHTHAHTHIEEFQRSTEWLFYIIWISSLCVVWLLRKNEGKEKNERDNFFVIWFFIWKGWYISTVVWDLSFWFWVFWLTKFDSNTMCFVWLLKKTKNEDLPIAAIKRVWLASNTFLRHPFVLNIQ